VAQSATDALGQRASALSSASLANHGRRGPIQMKWMASGITLDMAPPSLRDRAAPAT
jgi:hypothetical protein